MAIANINQQLKRIEIKDFGIENEKELLAKIRSITLALRTLTNC